MGHLGLEPALIGKPLKNEPLVRFRLILLKAREQIYLRAKTKKDFLQKKKSFTHMGHLGLEPRTKGL